MAILSASDGGYLTWQFPLLNTPFRSQNKRVQDITIQQRLRMLPAQRQAGSARELSA